ncbi:hypothetical protein ACNOYE_33365 [Nannocystaceae bacterium ST9]
MSRLASPTLTTSLCVLAITSLASACTSPADEGDDEIGESEASTGGETTAGETTSETGEELGPTWHRDIAPLIHEKCVGCHVEGGIGPFSLDGYAAAAPWASLALDAIVNHQMPPWGQDDTEDCQSRLPFLNDTRFTDEQTDLLAAWIDAGTPEGDPASAAPLPEPPATELVDADHSFPIPSSIDIGPGSDQLWCFVIDPQFAEDTFIDGMQIVPGNPSIVHHALVYVDETGESDALADANGRYECFGGPEVDGSLIAVWAPGVPPQETPEGVAIQIPAAAKLVIQIHYHPTGALETDPDTSVAFREAEGVPAYIGQYALPGNEDSLDNSGYGLQPGPNDQGEPEFRIPAGVQGHTERMLVPIPPLFSEAIIWQASSHMHYLGVDMRLGVDRFQPEPDTDIDEECFVQTPYYNFEWQRGYRYDGALADMPTVHPGDVLTLDCTFDNSMNNPHLAEALADQGLDAPVDVYLGEQTLDEMCLGVFGVAVEYSP